MRTRWLTLVVLAAAGCSECGPHPVPFQPDAGARPPAPVDLGRAASAFTPVDARELPDGTRTLDVEGAQVMAPAGTSTSLRSVLAVDVDADGDRDAVLVSSDESGAPALAFASRDGAAFSGTRVLAPLPLGAGCTAARIALRQLSLHWAALTLTPACATADGGVLPASPPVTWLVALAATPRLRDRIALLPADGRAAGDVALGVRIADVDGDGREDVRLDVSVDVAPSPAAQGRDAACRHALATLTWLDRPAGLARDTHEPEASLRTTAQAAKQSLRREPACALGHARAAVALHDVLCREGPGPRVTFGDSEGLACGASRGAGIATAAVVVASARQGDVVSALAAQASLASPSLDAPRADRDAAARALATLPSEAGATWLVGPSIDPGGGPDAHLPAIGFLDSDRLLLRGSPTRTWPIAAGAEPQIVDGPQVDWLVRGPTGERAIVDVHRGCDGYRLGVVATANVVDGVVVGRYAEEPLAVPAPMSGDCAHLPENVRRENGGVTVLGWAPQGAVVTLGAELWLAPLDPMGHATGAPSRLPDGAALPAPLPNGAATTDGRAFAVATPYGVLVRELVPSPRTVLLRPAEWAAAAGDVTDVALSPDTHRVAVVKGGVLYVITRGG